MTQDDQADGLDELTHPTRNRSAGQARNLNRQARNRIGTHLRTMYDSIVQQPVPSRFADLIARLDDAPPGMKTEDM